jgi:DNA polymerase
MQTDPSRPPLDLADLLRFYAEAGVDEALGEEPANRFQEAPATPAAPARGRRQAAEARPGREVQPAAPVAQPALALPDETQAARAREMAREARDLDELRAMLERFDGCNLKFTAKQTVFGDGDASAPLMLVGEAPGRDEDIAGRPFVGRSGQLLDRMLAAIGMSRRENAYIANVIPWRPPGNRTPTPLETEICRPFIERQIELANPKVLVTLGGPSAKVLLGATDGVLRMRGKWRVHVTASGVEIPTMPTLHPAYLLRNPAHKKLAWRDFLEIAAKLDG